MKYTKQLLTKGKKQLAYTLSVGCALSGLTYAQTETEDDPIVVIASRLPAALSSISYVDLQTTAEVDNRQQERLQDALNLTPGVHSSSTAGQEGQLATLFLRGLTTEYNQLLIDGVRVSDAVVAGNYGNVLSSFQLTGGDQVEIALGSQGVIHGSAAIGGLVGISNAWGNSEPATSFATEFGSDDYQSSQFAHSQTYKDVDYYFNVSHTKLEHDRVDADFEGRQFSAGARYRLSDETSLVLAGRSGTSELETTGVYGGLAETDYRLFSLKLLQEKDGYTGSTVLGHYNQAYDFGGFYGTDYRKVSLTSDHLYEVNELLSVAFGADLSENNFDSNGHEQDWTALGGYLRGELNFSAITLHAGIRGDEHSIFGFLPAYDFGVQADYSTGTSIRATFASGFRAPSFTDSEAFTTFFGTQLANGDLSEERFNSVELGLTQSLGEATLSITGYAHSLKDAITSEVVAFTPYTTRYINADGTSEVFGLDVGLSGSIVENFNYQLAWNYSLKNDVTAGFPRNTVAADLHYDGGDWLIGAGLSHRSRASYGGARELDAHLITRLYGHYQLTEQIRLTFRVENLFDEQYEVDPFASDPVTYQSVQGDLGRGTSVYAGVKATW